MNAKELRIGNLISVFGTNGNPEGWTEMFINAEHIGTCQQHPDWFRPVMITDKKLIQVLGFQRTPIEMYPKMLSYLKNEDFASKFRVWWYRDEILLEPMGEHTGTISVDYIHQVQNIYFSLTQTEFIPHDKYKRT